MRTRKSHLPLVIVLTILLSGLVFTPVLGMPQTDLSWRMAAQTYDYQAYFYYSPYDPSVCSTVSFYGYTEPYVPDATYSWDLGDGSTADGQYVDHRYADDGDYLVTLTVTTPDGGMSSFSQTVSVRTQAYLWYWPYDPSIYDAVYFQGDINGNYGWCSITYDWDFGDGTTAEGQYVQHQYAQDGDYQVALTATIDATVDATINATIDGGLTRSTTQTVMVRTHDVAIINFKVPQAAKAGQTRNITVGLSNKNYEELVEVCLYKNWQFVGCLQQTVPVRKGNRTTDFNFSYTFTNEDAAIGKVTFRAGANLLNYRDVLPADNEAIADPTKVSQ